MGLFDAVKNSFSGTESDEIWQTFSESSQLDTILEASAEKPQLVYKHSHRCSVCFEIASKLNVRHESPQVILLDDGEVIWDASHGDIQADAILDKLR